MISPGGSARCRRLRKRPRKIDPARGSGSTGAPLRAMDVQLEITEHVRSTSGMDGTVLLDLRSGKYFALNPVGSLVWQAIAAGASRGTAVERPAERLCRDADALLAELQVKGLLRTTDREKRPAPPKAAMALAEPPRTEECG